MEAGSLGGELDEDGDGAVGLRPRGGEEAVGDLSLNHHRPLRDRREPVEALDDDRRRHVVGQVRNELGRRGLEIAGIERDRVDEADVDVGSLAEAVLQVRRQPPVELDGVDMSDPVGQVLGQCARARADFEHDVVGAELGEPADDAEDVLVDEEVLAELLLRRDRDAHGRPNARDAFASICVASSAGSSPRVSARDSTV